MVLKYTYGARTKECFWVRSQLFEGKEVCFLWFVLCTTIGGFPNSTFRCILKKWSTALITEKIIYSNSLSASILVTFRPNYQKKIC